MCDQRIGKRMIVFYRFGESGKYIFLGTDKREEQKKNKKKGDVFVDIRSVWGGHCELVVFRLINKT